MGGIGHAIALGFAHHGADVVVADIDEEGARTTAEEIENLGRRTLLSHTDISVPGQVEELFSDAVEYFDQIDILVNVPFASPERVRPHELSLEGWDKTLAVSLTGYSSAPSRRCSVCSTRIPEDVFSTSAPSLPPAHSVEATYPTALPRVEWPR